MFKRDGLAAKAVTTFCLFDAWTRPSNQMFGKKHVVKINRRTNHIANIAAPVLEAHDV